MIKNEIVHASKELMKCEKHSEVMLNFDIKAEEEDCSVIEKKCMSLRKKPVIAEEVMQNVYFRNPSESPVNCLKRICSLISSSHQKLMEYQSKHKYHAKWGSPILINKQLNGSLLKESLKSKYHSHFRSPKIISAFQQSDQYDFVSSDDSDNLTSRNGSDDEWNIFQEKPKNKKICKRKSTKMPVVCTKPKKVKINGEQQTLTVEQPITNDLTEPMSMQLKSEMNVVDETNIEVNHEMVNSLVSKKEHVRFASKTKSFRKTFQLKNNLTVTAVTSVNKNSLCDLSGDLNCSLKRPLVECADFSNQDFVKKKKLSEVFDPSKSSPGSQDLFGSEGDQLAVKNKEPEISEEKSRDCILLECSDVLLVKDKVTESESTLKEKGEASCSFEMETENDVSCPICNQLFPMKEIEVHASDCDGLPNIVPDDCDSLYDRKLRHSSRRQ